MFDARKPATVGWCHGGTLSWEVLWEVPMPKGFFGFLSRHLTRRVQDAHGGLSEMILSAQHLARVGVEGSNPFARSKSANGLDAFSTQRMVLVFPGERGTPFSGWSKAKSALDTASSVSGCGCTTCADACDRAAAPHRSLCGDFACRTTRISRNRLRLR